MSDNLHDYEVQSRYVGSPEDSGECPRAAESDAAWAAKAALEAALALAGLAALTLLVAMLGGCASAQPMRWQATLTIRYANGQEITRACAQGEDR